MARPESERNACCRSRYRPLFSHLPRNRSLGRLPGLDETSPAYCKNLSAYRPRPPAAALPPLFNGNDDAGVQARISLIVAIDTAQGLPLIAQLSRLAASTAETMISPPMVQLQPSAKRIKDVIGYSAQQRIQATCQVFQGIDLVLEKLNCVARRLIPIAHGNFTVVIPKFLSYLSAGEQYIGGSRNGKTAFFPTKGKMISPSEGGSTMGCIDSMRLSEKRVSW